MKNYKTIMALLALFIISMSFVGCKDEHTHSFSPSYDEQNHFEICSCGEKRNATTHGLEWVVDREATDTIKGTKHLECSCGYKAEENTPIPIAKKEDGTLKLDDKLIQAISEYLREPSGDTPSYSLGDKLRFCSNGYTPLLVETGDEGYFVAVYSNETPENPGDYLYYEEYTWVGLEKATEIRESWNGEAFVAAFQVNPAKICKNLKTGETDYKMEHFNFFRPKFKDGFALERESSFKYLAIQLTESNEKQLYCSISSSLHEPFSIDCIELDGEYYIKQWIGTLLNDGSYHEEDLELAFGEYYDDLMKVMITGKYSVTLESGSTYEYGLFSMQNLASCMNKQNDSTQENTSDKQNLIAQIKQDWGSDTVEFTASPFAQEATLSYMYSIDVRIAEDEIYLNGILYDSVKVVDNSKIIHDEMMLDSANKAVTDEECSEIIEKLRNFENCYLLETESGEAISQMVAVYKIDGKYYLSSFWPEIEGMVIRIHFADIGKEE